LDAYGDTIAPGAFKSTLAKAAGRGCMPKMLLQHGGSMFGGAAEDGIPVGKWTSMTEDTKGLKCEGELFALNTQKGQYIYEGLKAGVLDGLSIGYVPIGIKYGQKAGDPERTLTEVELHECSIVTFPANDKALVSQVKLFERLDQLKTISDFEQVLRDAGLSRREAKTFLSRHKATCLNQSDSDGPSSELLRRANTLASSLLSNITQRK